MRFFFSIMHEIVCVIVCLSFWAIVSTQVITECSLYDYDSEWDDALWTCRNRRKTLLCYNSKDEIQRIIDYFYPSLLHTKNIRVWLSRTDCNDFERFSKCLSLLVNHNQTHVWHSFQHSCNLASFICCTFRRDVSSSSTTTVLSTPLESTTIASTATSSALSTDTTKYFITTSTPFVPSHSTTSSTEPSLLLCPSAKKRGIVWPITIAGETVILPCPGSAIGNASWTCSKEGSWLSNPNTSLCRLTQLISIKDNFQANSAEETITSLNGLFADDPESVQGNDLKDAVSLLSLLPEKMQQECKSAIQDDCWSLARELVTKTTSLVSRMVELETWEDISSEEVSKAGSDMLSACDKFGFFLSNSMSNMTSYHSVVDRNIAIEVSRYNSNDEPLSLPQDLTEHSRHGQVLLDIHQPHSSERPLSIIYIYYSNMSKILVAQNSGSLNSPVVSTSVSQGGLSPLSIKGQVHVLVEHLYSGQNTTCVFWNLKNHHWDPRGCRLKSSNSSHSLCQCDHLTNFAVLMDYKGLLLDIDDPTFFYITVIGCSISLVALAICIAVFTFYRWQKGNTLGVRYSIHRNLCITLFLGNIVLIAGFNQSENKIACAVVAGLLHYLYLSAFSWMLLEGVHIYVLLVIVFASKKTHWKMYYLFGYGFPLLVVGITAATSPSSYGTEEVCWLSVNNGTVWSFTGPVAVILLMNSAALVLAQYKASRISSKDHNIAIVKRWLRVTFILFPILGLTWIVGFLYLGKNFIVAAYIFATLNSLQGFFIFLCHCLLDKRSRNMVVNAIRKKLPSIDTESSGTNKRSRKDTNKKGLLRSGSSRSSTETTQRTWWKPWAFIATLNLAKTNTVHSISRRYSSEEPEILQWKKVHETNAL